MKKLNLFSLLFIATFLFQCSKENDSSLLKEKDDTNYQAFHYQASSLLEIFENPEEAVIGLLVKADENGLFFEKVFEEEGLLRKESIADQPTSELVFFDQHGNVKTSPSTQYALKKFQYNHGGFDFIYFSKMSIFSMIKYSDNVYISGANVNLGIGKQTVESDTKIFSLKMEGDYQNIPNNIQRNDNLPLPLVIIGHPCPPAWYSF